MADFIADRSFSSAPIYVTDLERCQPADRLSPDGGFRRWHTIPYEAEGFSGVMLKAGPETRAPEVRYPLSMTGWYAISIGIHPTSEEGLPQALVKLSGDDTYSVLTWDTGGHHLRRKQLQEIFWKVADLNGQAVDFCQLARRIDPGDGFGSVQCGGVRIAYIKLVPLTPTEVDALHTEQQEGGHRCLFAHNDSHGPHFLYRPTSAEELRREIEAYRDTDFSRMYWESGSGDVLHYPTKIGRTPDIPDITEFARVGDRLVAESWRSYLKAGLDPFAIALEHTHAIGLEFHAAYRLAGWTYPPPLDHNFRGGYYQNHPELHCVDRDGKHLPRLSYAFRETQDYCLALLREMAQYPIDGICLLFNRRPPYIAYEAPLFEAFATAHGSDPRELADTDPTWLEFCGGVMTDFMRRVREEMDAMTREQGRGRRIEVSACVLGLEEENRYFGLDVAAWAKEGLIDVLIPYSPAPLAMPTEEDTWSSPSQLQPFVRATQGTSCVLAPNVMPRHQSPEDFRRNAYMLYGAGADHLFFWDCAGPGGRANYQPMWNVLRRLGHREEIVEWVQTGEPPLGDWTKPLLALGDWDMTVIAPG